MKRFPRFNHLARICVVGVGGGGSNAVNRMIHDGVRGVDFIAVNTDTLALLLSEAPTRIQVGDAGQGAGGDVYRGRKAALQSKAELAQALNGADMVFVTAGMGGGTGSGAAPIIAQIAREQNALTIGVVTRPFAFEGGQRVQNARRGIEELQNHVDNLITIDNDRLFKVTQENTSLHDAFKHTDNILKQAVQSITEIITRPGTINLDFADVRAVMGEGGNSIMAVGQASGENAAIDAAREAVQASLLGFTVDGAKGMLFNVRASHVSAVELNNAASIIRERAHPDVNFIFGFVEDPLMGDEVRITVIATGVEGIVHEDRQAELVQEFVQQVNPGEENVRTRRVYMSRPKKKRRTQHDPNKPRFSRNQWGIPAYLRN